VILSVVIPMLNEETQLPDLVHNLRSNLPRETEIVVVDGGSTDASVEVCRNAGLKVVTSAAGRALQMNRGAQDVRGDVILFLHADTRLPPQAFDLIQTAMEKCVWGRFDIKIEGAPQFLKVVAWLINLRSRITGIATGDQAIFVKSNVFKEMGGFPRQPLMEDVDLSAQLKKRSRPACLRTVVRTSGRRWEKHGVFRTIVLMWWLRWQHWIGVPLERIARSYK
jgi:rSAM/selenodomain-associated transferase 2